MDKIEACKNIELLNNEIKKLQSLCRNLMTAKEMVDTDKKIIRHKDQIKTIESNLNA
ncbi:MAG: hypothetical protein GAK29_00895 [Acinetobacter bereziniae]|uniref:Uncharacterized protein n=1 Tax=Acinetobacter bereziniae TaxID=106648 RepID=A0A833UT42_ACIBZ|nr:MAG: hypothetical protein GAK29_00895 [Acinetobacter bereziniae]